MRSTVHDGPLTAVLRECWIDPFNLRISCEREGTIINGIHSVIIESVKVEEAHRNQGHFKRFLAVVCADPRFDMVVVEGVQNPILAEALARWGWECNVGVSDFYRRRT